MTPKITYKWHQRLLIPCSQLWEVQLQSPEMACIGPPHEEWIHINLQ